MRRGLLAALGSCCMLAAIAIASAGALPNAAVGDSAAVTAPAGRLLLDGKPFFPILAMITRCPSSATVGSELSIGVNVLDGYGLSCGSTPGNTPDTTEAVRVLHAALAGRVMWKEFDPRVGYPPTGLPELTEWKANVTWDTGGAVGVRCKTAGISGPYDTIASQVRLKKIVVLRIPVANDSGAQPGMVDCLKHPATFAEWFWASIAAGAQGIEYMTQSKGQDAPLFDVPNPIQAEAHMAAGRLKSLLPVIMTGTRRPVLVSGLRSVRAASFSVDEVSYVIAVNEASSPGQARLQLDVRKSASLPVLWEGRNESINAVGVMTDRFTGFGVHIYKLKR